MNKICFNCKYYGNRNGTNESEYLCSNAPDLVQFAGGYISVARETSPFWPKCSAYINVNEPTLPEFLKQKKEDA